MEKNNLKQSRKKLFSQLRKAEQRLESASVLLDRDAYVDAIPSLYKSVDIILRTLTELKKKPSPDYLTNLQTVKEEYRKENFMDEETIEFLGSLSEMNKNYQAQLEAEYSETEIKETFQKTEKFFDNIRKVLKDKLTTEEERKAKRRTKKFFLGGIAAAGLGVVVFFIVQLAINSLGPQPGLLAHYYNNISLKGAPVMEEIDKKIDFTWGKKTPHPRITNHFSVRWEGQIKIDTSGDYVFYIKSDEGVKLFIDERTIIDTWSMENRPLESSSKIHLDKGFHDIKLEYFFNQRHSSLKLLWSSPFFSKKIVGSKVLFPPGEINTTS